MEVTKGKGATCEAPKSLTKEQLEGALNNLSTQAEHLYKENQQLKKLAEEMNMTNLFKRLDYLFRIINEDNKFISEEFKAKCAKEIEELMTPPAQEEVTE